MSFKAFEEVHGDLSLELPFRGKTYVIQPPNARDGMALAKRLAASIYQHAGGKLTDDEIHEYVVAGDEDLPDLARQCLNGPFAGEPQLVYEEMLVDGLTHTEVEFAVSTAFLAWTVDKAAAEAYWNSAGKAPASRPLSTARRPTETPTLTAAATSTAATPSGTSSRRKARAKAAKAARSGGSSRTTTT